MKPCPPPSGALLLPRQRPYFFELMNILEETGYLKSKIDPLLPQITQNISDLCSNEDELRAWLDEAQQWVRWWPVPAYWLTFILQMVTKQRNSIQHFLACSAYAEAQINFADDLALSSLETSYNSFVRNRAALGENYEPVGCSIVEQLRFCHAYYSQWARPFDYKRCNPCTEHIYMEMSLAWLRSGMGDENKDFVLDDVPTLTSIIEHAQGDDFAYYGVLARRFLGLAHQLKHEYETSAKLFEEALAEARRMRLDTEIGHLRRMLGYALRLLDKNEEARHHLEQALAFERLDARFIYTGYWQAVSAYELGDVLVRSAGRRVPARHAAGDSFIYDDLEKLRPALAAYHDARMALSAHLSLQSPFPLARAAKQQIFRSFGGNAVQVACLLQSQHDFLAQVEAGGPREATEIVSEIAAEREISITSLPEFRRNRGLFFKTLNTDLPKFDDYLESIPKYNAERRSYLLSSFTLDQRLLKEQWCDEIVRRVTALKLPETLFVMFHFNEASGMLALLDMASGVAAPFSLAFGEAQIHAAHAEYRSAASRDLATRKLAMDVLLSRYEEWLGPTLESFAKFLPGKHLKIFPRLQMNEAPLHAVRVRGKRLIEHCASVSYGQTLGLFLSTHEPLAERPGALLRFVLGDDVPWYERLLPKLRQGYGAKLETEQQLSWPELVEACRLRPARDVMLACHGVYVADDLDSSFLQLALQKSEGKVTFSRVFEELDLRGCRSVIMGACQSGLARAEVGAEYIGLASAMLSSGVRYVVGALWTIPQLATAVLIDHYLKMLENGSENLCFVLSEAQRQVMTMTRGEVVGWVVELIEAGPELDGLLKNLAKLPDRPFAHPYYWAGLQVLGDV